MEPLSVPPPSSILDQFEVDFPPEPPSVITSRLSAGIGEWRLLTNLVSEQKYWLFYFSVKLIWQLNVFLKNETQSKHCQIGLQTQ